MRTRAMRMTLIAVGAATAAAMISGCGASSTTSQADSQSPVNHAASALSSGTASSSIAVGAHPPAPRSTAGPTAPSTSPRPSPLSTEAGNLHSAAKPTATVPRTPPASAPPMTPPTTQESVLLKLPGSTRSDVCVTVGSHRDVTSGSIAMGNFASAQKSYKSQYPHSQVPTVNLYVIPEHRSMPGVRITMTPTTATGKARTVRSTTVEPADIWKYYSVQLPVPESGSWRLKVASGSDHGCFDVTFRG